MFNVDAAIEAQFRYLEARRLHRKRLNMISTAPVGTIYTVGNAGSLVIKCNSRGDAKGLIEVLNTHGQKFTFETPQLFEAEVSETIKAQFLALLNRYQSTQVSTKGTPENKSDGSTASYYQLPANCKELQDLISYRNMNAQMGEIFRATYRFGMASHSDQLRDAKKIKFYIEAEIKRLESQ